MWQLLFMILNISLTLPIMTDPGLTQTADLRRLRTSIHIWDNTKQITVYGVTTNKYPTVI